MARNVFEEMPENNRTRVGNGRSLMLGGVTDERSHFARRVKEVAAAHIADLGGLDAVSEGERSIVRRIAILTIQLEKLEVRFADDPTVGERTLDLYNRTSGNLGRLLDRIGLKRRSRDITPTLDQYINGEVVR